MATETQRVRPDRIPVVCFEIVGLFDQVRVISVCSATETTSSIEILPEVGLSVTISTDKCAGFDIIAV